MKKIWQKLPVLRELCAERDALYAELAELKQQLAGSRRQQRLGQERQLLATGRLLAGQVMSKGAVGSLSEVEFRVFSQWGDDGIIQWLVGQLDIPNRTFVEFGVEDYRESNTRFLMMNNNWSGLVMDGSDACVQEIASSEYLWRHDLQAKAAFIDADNINALLSEAGFDPELGLLHIDLDGNDYWIWRAIEGVTPIVVVVEYNALFGAERPITVPYDKAFCRSEADASNLYYGASLAALCHLAEEKGYAFVGSNSAGNNAYFVRRDKLCGAVRELSCSCGYVASTFREGRDARGGLSLLRGDARLASIRGLPVWNVIDGQMEVL